MTNMLIIIVGLLIHNYYSFLLYTRFHSYPILDVVCRYTTYYITLQSFIGLRNACHLDFSEHTLKTNTINLFN